jgi:murein DD-endopeptidase MepM/ murein hydrolase activator NlpD
MPGRYATALAALLLTSPSIAQSNLRVTAADRSLQPGEVVVLTIVAPDSPSELRVRAFDRAAPAFRVTATSWGALVGIDLDTKPGTYSVAIDATPGDEHTTYSLRVRPKHFATRTLTVDEAFVNPPASEQPRIEREAAELHRIYQRPDHHKLWDGPFVRPVPGAATSVFGTRSIFNGQPRNPHGGADFLSPAGTSIHAPNAGRIVLARDQYFSGNTILIDHGLGVFSMLAHLSAFDVREGDMVQAGQVVGRVGATGRVTGPHLHWAVRIADARVDPLAVLALLGKNGGE